MSTWNGGAPQDQDMWIDDIVITNETPTARDVYGNPMIGPDAWPGGGITTISVGGSGSISFGGAN